MRLMSMIRDHAIGNRQSRVLQIADHLVCPITDAVTQSLL
jgi:hypothetical protein